SSSASRAAPGSSCSTGTVRWGSPTPPGASRMLIEGRGCRPPSGAPRPRGAESPPLCGGGGWLRHGEGAGRGRVAAGGQRDLVRPGRPARGLGDVELGVHQLLGGRAERLALLVD